MDNKSLDISQHAMQRALELWLNEAYLKQPVTVKKVEARPDGTRQLNSVDHFTITFEETPNAKTD